MASAAQIADVNALGDAPRGKNPCARFCADSTYFMVLIVLINMVLFADQNLLAPVLTPIAREYGWVIADENGTTLMEFDENIGREVEVVDGNKRDLYLTLYIPLGFFMIGGLASLVGGYLADSVNRRNALCAVVAFGETACLMTYWTTDFTGLFITRTVTGVSIGAAIPLLMSLIGDLFDKENRGKAVAASITAVNFGGVAGQVMAGIVAGSDGSNWRLSFVFVAVPAYLLIVAILLTVDEPARGTREEAAQEFLGDDKSGEVEEDLSEKITWAKFVQLMKIKTVFLVLLQGIPGSLPWGVLLGVFNDFLIESKNIARDQSGAVVFSFAGGAAFGAIFGGWLCDRFHSKMRIIPLIMGVSTAAGAVPMIALVQLPPQSLVFYMFLSFPSGFIIGITGTAVKVVLLNVTLPETRGAAFAVFNLFDDIGKSLGSAIVVALILSFGGREQGLTFSMLGWVLGALVHFVMYFTIEKDYETGQEIVRERLLGGDKRLSEKL